MWFRRLSGMWFLFVVLCDVVWFFGFGMVFVLLGLTDQLLLIIDWTNDDLTVSRSDRLILIRWSSFLTLKFGSFDQYGTIQIYGLHHCTNHWPHKIQIPFFLISLYIPTLSLLLRWMYDFTFERVKSDFKNLKLILTYLVVLEQNGFYLHHWFQLEAIICSFYFKHDFYTKVYCSNSLLRECPSSNTNHSGFLHYFLLMSAKWDWNLTMMTCHKWH